MKHSGVLIKADKGYVFADWTKLGQNLFLGRQVTNQPSLAADGEQCVSHLGAELLKYRLLTFKADKTEESDFFSNVRYSLHLKDAKTFADASCCLRQSYRSPEQLELLMGLFCIGAAQQDAEGFPPDRTGVGSFPGHIVLPGLVFVCICFSQLSVQGIAHLLWQQRAFSKRPCFGSGARRWHLRAGVSK